MSMQTSFGIESFAGQKLSVHDLISIHPLTLPDIQLIFALAQAMKQSPREYADALKGKALALIFEKPSLRTRVTFDVGMTSMGGSAIFLDHSDAKLGERESVRDVARNLERWVQGIVARTYKNKSVVELAEHACIPVINGLTDLLHPCQALTDYFTILERFGSFQKLKFAYVGDGNNTCHSLIDGAVKLGVELGGNMLVLEGLKPGDRYVVEGLQKVREGAVVQPMTAEQIAQAAAAQAPAPKSEKE